ncbi:unnamed protein product [Dibothriocephalus latus]|uniref:Choline/carnitine acyltransferase domain-containing protein n=1 Tax=Dibothriocephalus latus TaxID=60516 RepID=A0A3P6RGA7_DIBLA|nr:unnamed protein product [Dibothriocephalus latus]
MLIKVDQGPREVIFKPCLPSCISAIESSYTIARELADSVDLVVRRFEDFGKRIPKKFGLSPDSFLQMAFQLAYYMVRSPPHSIPSHRNPKPHHRVPVVPHN